MSWLGLKKSLSRANISLLQKTRAIERTVDSDYEEAFRHFEE
jgi:hypothetical protein